MSSRTTGFAVGLAALAGFVTLLAQAPPGVAGREARTVHQAAQAGDAAAVEAMVSSAPSLLDAGDESGRTPLHWACRGVHLAVVETLVARGANVNARDRAGVAPLHSAASRGHLAAAVRLLSRGAQIDARMADGNTPLHLAAANGHMEVVRLLVGRGAALEIRNASEDSPLHAAARSGKWEVVEWMVDQVGERQRPALDVGDFDGATLLHMAARSGRETTVARLASKGANLDARTLMGQTAYNIAEEVGASRLTTLLAEEGADRSPARFPRLSGPYLGQSPPGTTPEIFAKGIVSTRQGVYGTIVFSPDQREAFWHPEGGAWLLWARRNAGAWSAPRRFPFAARPSIAVPFFSFDGRRLYFMAGSRDATGIVSREEIWCVERQNGGWSEPRGLDPVVNSGPMHWQFSLDRLGNIYFSGNGGIQYARFENGMYRPPELLPAPVNVPHPPEERYRSGDVGPFVSPDGDFLIFTRFGNGVGLWVSFRQPDGTWREPRNLSEHLGGSGNDSAAQVTPDGKYLFFQSVRPGSAPSRSVYWVDARAIEGLRR